MILGAILCHMMMCTQCVIAWYTCHDYLWYIGYDKHVRIIHDCCINWFVGEIMLMIKKKYKQKRV